MNKQLTNQTEIDRYLERAIYMIHKEEKVPSQVKRALIEMGAEEGVAAEIVRSAQELIREGVKKQANRDILFGSLWCIGGTVLTLANVGFIFWGAIVFGGAQLIKGLISRGN